MSGQLPVRAYASAGGVVVDAQGERVLTLLRPGRAGPDGRMEVRLPKGHIEPGESREQTAIREVHEEAGLSGLKVLADLGQQTVEFDWNGFHYIRDESYLLLAASSEAATGHPEPQFRIEWLTWDEALDRLSFEAEREWLRRALAAWAGQADRGS